MGSFQHSKQSDNKGYTVEVRWGIIIENLIVFFIPNSIRKYSHTSSYIFAMALISQGDHHTVRAWDACASASTFIDSLFAASIPGKLGSKPPKVLLCQKPCKPWKEWTRLDYMSDLKNSSKRRIKREAMDKNMRYIWTHQIFKTFNVLRKANKQMYTQTKTKLPRKRTVKNMICFDSLCRNPVLQWTVLRTFLRKECM